jgi:septum formation protein
MIILASNSPRRKELLKGLGVDFEVQVMPGIDESYPEDMPAKDVAEYIATKKSVPYITEGTDNVVITADTVVVCDGIIMGKPADEADAKRMLHALSGKTHQVYTGVCIKHGEGERHFSVCTDVTFKKLSNEEIDHYVKTYKPYDKAGSYGIQEWIGYVGITGINGSYYNVMGFPVQRVYEELSKL